MNKQHTQTHTHRHDRSMVVPERKGEVIKGEGAQIYVTEGDLTLSDKHHRIVHLKPI